MPGPDDDANGRGRQPRALIVSVYGLYAREDGGWLSVATLIRLLAELGVDEPAVRSSISRLKRRGILVAERVGGAAGYGLSAEARGILDEGDRRIFDRPRAGVDEGWLLAVFSVPEAEREKRHQLRSRLAWLGFGTVAAGVWVAPEHLLDETHDALSRQGLAGYVDLFRADHAALGDQRAKVAQWWDLERLRSLYSEFLAQLPAGPRAVPPAAERGRAGGLRRLPDGADRLAPPALPRPRAGTGAAAAALAGGAGGRDLLRTAVTPRRSGAPVRRCGPQPLTRPGSGSCRGSSRSGSDARAHRPARAWC